jgi:non-homologous end joining protein Ku
MRHGDSPEEDKMAYRNLTLSLGLVAVNVGVDPLTDRSARPSGKTFTPDTLEPIKRPTVESVTLYEREDGALVDIGEVEKDKTSKLIELTGFVSHVPAEMVETTYQVTPAKGGEKGLNTIRLALLANGAYGVGVINWDKAPKQVVIEATEWGVGMHVLTYADQFRARKTWVDESIVTDQEVDLAGALINASMKEEIVPIADAHAKRMREAILKGDVKKDAAKPAPVSETDNDEPVDLLASLRASVDAQAAIKEGATS